MPVSPYGLSPLTDTALHSCSYSEISDASEVTVSLKFYLITVPKVTHNHFVAGSHRCQFLFLVCKVEHNLFCAFFSPGTGQLFVCGHNKDGQLGLNHTEDVLHFTLCTALSGFCVKQVACGWDFTIILVGKCFSLRAEEIP